MINKILKLVFSKKTNLVDSLNSEFITILKHKFNHDREALLPIIDKVPECNLMIEIGSLCGFSTRFFSRYFKKVISIDPYTANYDKKDINSDASRLSIARDIFRLRFFDDPTVSQINASSAEASIQILDKSVDFIYIDAGHNYEAVKQDILLWRPKLKSAAIMAGDDYEWPGLKRAVEEIFPKHDVIAGRWVTQLE
jgi:predicted O-methyltransferase YrrM